MTQPMTDLDKLAERVEQASGDERLLFINAYEAINGTESIDYAKWGRFEQLINSLAYLDAAMSLVPEGYVWGCGTDAGEPENKPWAWCDEPGELPDDYLRFAATPALALCAASLRALSIMKAGNTGETGRSSTDGEGAR